MQSSGSMTLSRQELLGIMIRLAIFGVVSYYGIKWVVDQMDPTKKQKAQAQKQAERLMNKIGIKGVKLTEYEMTIAALLIDPLGITVSWQDIGGLEDVIDEIKETVILPMKKRHLFRGSSLLQPPKGILLHGPPGCGKTMIAKAMAKEAGFRFINLQASTLTDKWYGESQKLAAAVFSLAIKIQPTIIFIDEVDSFLRSRASYDHEATAMMKAQFMSLWDGLITDNSCQVIVMGATNRPQDVDSAILRRMPTMFHIGMPDKGQRKKILELILCEEYLSEDMDLSTVAEETEGYSGSDLHELCRNGSVFRVKDYMKEQRESGEQEGDSAEDGLDMLRPLALSDLQNAKLKMDEAKRKRDGRMESNIGLD
ncbi:outer mitochondrial transmembrane helix translocase-like [Ptychodera flava]|uniref:outer mitochondrial transmembrane helix translocase-like n=1 Tax=Ptychodera flava TaxID=63121 RepID=UPI003969D0E8